MGGIGSVEGGDRLAEGLAGDLLVLPADVHFTDSFPDCARGLRPTLRAFAIKHVSPLGVQRGSIDVTIDVPDLRQCHVFGAIVESTVSFRVSTRDFVDGVLVPGLNFASTTISLSTASTSATSSSGSSATRSSTRPPSHRRRRARNLARSACALTSTTPSARRSAAAEPDVTERVRCSMPPWSKDAERLLVCSTRASNLRDPGSRHLAIGQRGDRTSDRQDFGSPRFLVEYEPVPHWPETIQLVSPPLTFGIEEPVAFAMMDIGERVDQKSGPGVRSPAGPSAPAHLCAFFVACFPHSRLEAFSVLSSHELEPKI